MADLKARLVVPLVRGELVVLGFAPWDWRMVLYAPLAKRNAVVYHTSWPYWDTEATPRQYGMFNPVLRSVWRRVLKCKNVRVVCVLEETRLELATQFDIGATVIPHAVPQVFFDARHDTTAPRALRLLFVGQLSERKGVTRLLKIMHQLNQTDARLTIVGDGPLRERCIAASEKQGNISYLGAIHDRTLLAREMASHDILLVLSVRDSTWEELFGIVIAEASATGLGVIASNHIGPRSLLARLNVENLFADDDDDGVLGLIERLATEAWDLSQFKLAHRGLAESFREDLVAERWAAVLGASPERLVEE